MEEKIGELDKKPFRDLQVEIDPLKNKVGVHK